MPIKSFNLRLPEELLNKLKRMAEEQNRSVNQQVITILQNVIAVHEKGKAGL